MTYNLFIHPTHEEPRDGRKWQRVRSIEAAKNILELMGKPNRILIHYEFPQENISGAAIAQWLIQLDLNRNVIDEDFEFDVSSGNVIEASNMKKMVDSYKRFKFKRNA
jgi:hypothetical protein